jgi:hypothetical protein
MSMNADHNAVNAASTGLADQNSFQKLTPKIACHAVFAIMAIAKRETIPIRIYFSNAKAMLFFPSAPFPNLLVYSLVKGFLSIFDVLILAIFHFLKQIKYNALIPAVFMGYTGNGKMIPGLAQIAYGVGGEKPLQAPGFKIKNTDIEYVVPAKSGYFYSHPVAPVIYEFKMECQVFNKNVKMSSEKVYHPRIYQLIAVYENFVYLGLVHISFSVYCLLFITLQLQKIANFQALHTDIKALLYKG